MEYFADCKNIKDVMLHANAIKRFAEDQQTKEGEFATVYASQLEEMMKDLISTLKSLDS